MTERRRLHISPFNPDLLPIVLPPPGRKTATNISYHALQVFPERNYGYVELPVMEAERIKKKFNGSILKGSRMQIEVARPEKKSKRAREEDAAEDSSTPVKKAKKFKSKKEEGVLSGYELPKDRKVKRGWTEPPAKESKPAKVRKEKNDKKGKPKKSSFTDKAECLFKTTLPPNATKLEKSSVAGVRKVKAKKRGESDRAVVVHEFENTAKHASFLRNDQNTAGGKGVAAFVDDVGWVGEKGNVLEGLPQIRRPRSNVEKKTTPHGEQSKPSKELKKTSNFPINSEIPALEDDETSSSGISSSGSDSEADSTMDSTAASPLPVTTPEASHQSVKTSKKTTPPPLTLTRSSASPSPSRSQPSSSGKPEVHPLEALFKRPADPLTPKRPTLEVRTSFSDRETADATTKLLIPQTPFTQLDRRQRGQRSAAPTPDTAAIGGGFGFGFGNDSEDEDDDDEPEGDDNAEDADEHVGLGVRNVEPRTVVQDEKGAKGENAEKEESDFAKWFWEHRGETNRAWKRRKREAGKEARQKGNRERGGRGGRVK